MSKLKLLLAIFLLNITAALAEPKINARTAIVVDYIQMKFYMNWIQMRKYILPL